VILDRLLEHAQEKCDFMEQQNNSHGGDGLQQALAEATAARADAAQARAEAAAASAAASEARAEAKSAQENLKGETEKMARLGAELCAAVQASNNVAKELLSKGQTSAIKKESG
jgi:predicted Zn-dependent protease